jgi:hypothetical protein
MRAEIESLLQQQEGASRFIETPALHLAAESLTRVGAFSSFPNSVWGRICPRNSVSLLRLPPLVAPQHRKCSL